ncbi:MAG: hypothetical protein HETSPECPRED_005519 [Heterodermia speciosa]|uniref:Uncharacterized protein n=1 Tax=Heterodermia speciosa TaxID=116794 RepID=A0A8H3FDU7_9LECA|nr:MAG: hypothetical protein HETSPECPRED_005519 [Heterodermia speciosa]
MRSATVIAASAALVAGANAWANDTIIYTTEVLTAYTTYCPAATSVVHNSKTYTVTEATTLTITDCPCTVTKPVYTSPVVYCSTCPVTTPTAPVETTPVPVIPSTPVETPTVPVVSTTPVSPVGTTPVPVIPSSSPAPYPISSAVYVNSTVPVPTGVTPVGSGSAPVGVPTTTSPTSPAFTGAANKMAASSVSLAGLLALAAYLL